MQAVEQDRSTAPRFNPWLGVIEFADARAGEADPASDLGLAQATLDQVADHPREIKVFHADSLRVGIIELKIVDLVFGRAYKGTKRSPDHNPNRTTQMSQSNTQTVECPKCDGAGFEGVEQDTGLRFTCYFCSETGRVSAEAASDYLTDSAVPVNPPSSFYADARGDYDHFPYELDDDLPVAAPVAIVHAAVISVNYRAVDGFSKRGTFKTLAGAQKFAQRYIGQTPEVGSGYAISSDGVGAIRASGVQVSDLFPALRS